MKQFLYFIILVFLFSCSSNTIYKKPNDLIPKDTMELLLIDMYIAVSARNVNTKKSKKIKNFLPVVYQKYKIDSVRFYSSNNYYTSKNEEYSAILTTVKDNIEHKYSVYEKALSLKDSLKKKERRAKRKRNKAIDSLEEAQDKKGYIPSLRPEIKTDSTRFYDNNEFYTAKIEEYTLILYPKEDDDKIED